MVKSLTSAGTSNPLKLIPIITDAAAKFEDENNDCKATEHAGALANLL